MSRRSKGARLYLRHRRGREPVWVIRDGADEIGTGCGADERRSAEERLAAYIASKYTPPTGPAALDRLSIADVVGIYLRERGPEVANREFLAYTALPILQWWEGKTLADVRGATCRDYVTWRCQEVSEATARHDLKTLRAAINHYHREHGPLPAVPAVTLPAKPESKERHLTVSEAAALLRACRSSHTARLILVGLHTGTRPGAILRLQWLPSASGGWFDLDAGVMHRRGSGARQSKKRAPPARIPAKLLPHLRRWRSADLAVGVPHVVHWQGQQVHDVRTSWERARAIAGLGDDVTPHVLRHTCVTWLLQAGVPTWEVAGFVGMSEDTVRQVYGHHSAEHMARAARGRR